jgi:hypothetical protein
LALLAEELVEEWLNRQGYFTIRGIKLGVDEIDLLATRISGNGEIECRHIEVQASMRPVSYISKVPKKQQKLGRPSNSAKRSEEELVEGVREWCEKKFTQNKKATLMKGLCPKEWSSELVINVVKAQEEVELIKSHGIKILHLSDIVQDLGKEKFIIESASGADFVDLIQMTFNKATL